MAFAVPIARGIFDLIRDDMALVEQEIAAQNCAAIEPVAEISKYLREGGGKRLRPALLLLAAGASGYRGKGAIRLGAVVEMIHSATLIHDDVIDGANIRRGRPSANARWGNHMSVLAGDWLYMQSFATALRRKKFCSARYSDRTHAGNGGRRAAAAHAPRPHRPHRSGSHGARVSQDRRTFQRLLALGRGARQSAGFYCGKRSAEYGRNAGLAFQLVDDLLDFTASPEKRGKPVLSDLKEGKVTLPLIFALATSPTGTATRADLVAKVLEERDFVSVRPEEITKLVRETGSLERSATMAREYVGRAKECLQVLPDTDGTRRALLAVPDFRPRTRELTPLQPIPHP